MGSHQAPDFSALLARIANELSAHEIPFMLIGGQAVLLHGRPRLTEDIDITLGVDISRLDAIERVSATLGLKPLPTNVAEFVAETFVFPVRDEASSIRVDFIFSTTVYERQAIERAVHVPLGGASVPFATAEDLVIHKLFAGRPRDVEDAEGVVMRLGNAIDWNYVEFWAREFAGVPGREDLPARVAALRHRAR